MQGIILAAGRGTRMGEATQGLPKCLLEVGGRPLLHRQLDLLSAAGVGPITIVVGFQADQVRRSVAGRAQFVFNPHFAETNSLHSLLTAGPKGPFLLLHGDMLFTLDLPKAVLARGPDCLAYDASSGKDEESMKVRVRDGRLADMGKHLILADGESTGMLCLSEKGATVLLKRGQRLPPTEYWAAALRASLDEIEVQMVNVAGIPWFEIDSPEDLENARRRPMEL